MGPSFWSIWHRASGRSGDDRSEIPSSFSFSPRSTFSRRGKSSSSSRLSSFFSSTFTTSFWLSSVFSSSTTSILSRTSVHLFRREKESRQHESFFSIAPKESVNRVESKQEEREERVPLYLFSISSIRLFRLLASLLISSTLLDRKTFRDM